MTVRSGSGKSVWREQKPRKGEVIRHHPSCTFLYPEKPENEKVRQLEEIDFAQHRSTLALTLSTSEMLDDDEVVLQCTDCGAFTIVKREFR